MARKRSSSLAADAIATPRAALVAAAAPSDAPEEVLDGALDRILRPARHEVVQHLARVGGEVVRVVPILSRADHVTEGEERHLLRAGIPRAPARGVDLGRGRRDARAPRLLLLGGLVRPEDLGVDRHHEAYAGVDVAVVVLR